MKQNFYKIYHNPRCSKSRKALELLKLKTENYKVIKYLEQKELVALGLLSQTDLTEDEYKQVLIEKQSLRDTYNN